MPVGLGVVMLEHHFWATRWPICGVFVALSQHSAAAKWLAPLHFSALCSSLRSGATSLHSFTLRHWMYAWDISTVEKLEMPSGKLSVKLCSIGLRKKSNARVPPVIQLLLNLAVMLAPPVSAFVLGA